MIKYRILCYFWAFWMHSNDYSYVWQSVRENGWKAVKDNVNKTVDDMKGTTMLRFFSHHKYPSIHHRCPAEDSCFSFQKSRAKRCGTSYIRVNKLFSANISKKLHCIRDIHSDFTQTDILSRCLKCRAQNPKESRVMEQVL